jgi:hypothetical protein
VKTFKGRLENLEGARADADLAIDETSLTLSTHAEVLGTWDFDAVGVRRSASDRFVLDLADERLIFIAADPVDFAYTVPGWVEAHKPKRRRGIQKRLERRKADLISRLEQSGRKGISRRIARSSDHVHAWRELKLAGGLVRRICEECDHVSIDLRNADLPEEVVVDPGTPQAEPSESREP